VPKRRARSIQALARAVHEGALRLDGAPSLDATLARLRSIADVSTTTAHYIAMRVYREPDAFPSNNPWLRQLVSANGEPVSIAELQNRAESWRPWRAYAAMHLWASLLSEETGAQKLYATAVGSPPADRVA
jgi:AraC family transcriptional regulator of adaptative response / DNA-3-methyladenine glycosylase II